MGTNCPIVDQHISGFHRSHTLAVVAWTVFLNPCIHTKYTLEGNAFTSRVEVVDSLSLLSTSWGWCGGGVTFFFFPFSQLFVVST
jgi:hypothetical protein